MAFRSDSTGTYTFPTGSSGSTVDLGARNTYRYINAINVYNKGKEDGAGFTETVIATVNPSGYTNNITLSQPITDFKYLKFVSSTDKIGICDSAQFKSIGNFHLPTGQNYYGFRVQLYVSDTQITDYANYLMPNSGYQLTVIYSAPYCKQIIGLN